MAEDFPNWLARLDRGIRNDPLVGLIARMSRG